MRTLIKLLVSAFILTYALTVSIFAEVITIRGTGIVSSAPNIAFINIGVNSEAATARIALDKNNKAMNNIINALTKIGVESRDTQTANFSISPRYDQSQNNQLPKAIGYNVFNTLNITIRNLENIGPILDKVVAQGSNRINNIRFAIENSSSLEDEARVLAAKDAQRRAEIYAATLGFSLGRITAITESTPRISPSSSPYAMRSLNLERADATPTPVESGSKIITSTVTIEWEISQ